MIDLILIALFQVASGDPAPPAEPVAPPVTEQQPAVQPGAENAERPSQQVRCRNERVVGSRMAVRVCTTPEQDAEMATEARDQINRGQGQSWTQN